MKMAARLERMLPSLTHYRGLTQPSKAGPVWTGKVALAAEHILAEPLKRRKPTTYFVNSMSDLFHEDVPDEWIDRVFAIMALCSRHTFQVLTKRSARMRAYMSAKNRAETIAKAAPRGWSLVFVGELMFDWPLPNVWLGVSCEDQRRADERIPDLLETPAAVRFVSAEPLLSALDLSKWLHDRRREGVFSADRHGPIRDRLEWSNLALGEMDGRRTSVGSGLYAEDESRAQFSEARELSSCDVQGQVQAAQGRRASDSLDDGQPTSYPAKDGNQSYRREQEEQRASELGVGNPSTERPTCTHVLVSEKEGPEGREELVCGGHRVPSAGDQEHLVEQIPHAEGDRGQVQNHTIDRVSDCAPQELAAPALDWIIAGGESGPGARPMHPDWARALRDQCEHAGTAYFFKQHGSWSAVYDRDKDDPDWRRCDAVVNDTPSGQWLNLAGGQGFHGERVVRVIPVSKKTAGRLLDGREHNDMPNTSSTEAAA
jgi:protein gp37